MKRRPKSLDGICAIVSKSHLAQARNMVASYKEHHPTRPAFVLVYDATLAELPESSESFVLIARDEFAAEYPDFYELAFKYTAFELACVLKPYFLLYLFKKFKLRGAFYVDSDIQFYSPIEKLHAQLEANSILLIPHCVKASDSSLDQATLYSEMLLLLTGSYNAGFIGVSATKTGIRFLRWWKERLSRDCAVAPSKGLYHDQRWLDLVPGLFDGVHVDRSEEFNVAFWNLRERNLNVRKGRYFCGSQPLAFFHFSHVNLDTPRKVSAAWTMRAIKPNKAVIKLIASYRESLQTYGYDEFSKLSYGFAHFDNGAVIPKEARRLFQRASLEKSFTDPFSTRSPQGFYRWMLKKRATQPPPLKVELKNAKTSLAKLDPTIRAALSRGSKNR